MSNQAKQLNKHLKQFYEHLLVERNCSPLTVRNYKHYLKRFSHWWLKQSNKGDITKLDLDLVRKYRVHLTKLEDEHGEQLLAKTTQSYHIIALRSFLKWLTKQDVEVLAPEKIDLPKAKNQSLKFLKPEELERLLDSVNTHDERGLRDRAILEVLFSTGLRVSELAKLNRDQFNFKAKEFGVIGKGGRARVVFLSDQAIYWLRAYFSAREDEWRPAFIRYSRGKEAQHPQGDDMRLTTRSIQRIVEKYRKKAKLSVEITPHGMRHTFATDLLFHGAGLREVQEMLGHKNIATTQIYTHVTNPQLRKIHQKYHSGNSSKTKTSPDG